MNYQNFVFKLTPEHIEQVIQDNELMATEYSFKYAIDTYDIINYCLPYTDNIFSNPKHRNYFAQRLIAYSDFFKTNTTKTYICKEYQEELRNVIDNILNNHNNLFGELDENIKSILLLFKTDTKSPDADYIKLVRHNLELVVTLLILDQEYSSESKERHNFIKENFKVFKLEKPDYAGSDIILNKLADASENPLVPVVFKSFVDEVAFHLMEVNSRVSRYHYLETTYSDIEVICKLAEVNKKLDEENQKTVVLYLSSAPKKSGQIFTILNRLSADGVGLPAISDFDSFNFQRNIFQPFLLKKLTEKYPGNHEAVKSALKLIKKIAIQIEIAKPQARQSETEMETVILDKLSEEEKKDFFTVKKLLENISADIENHFYYDKFRELFSETDYKTDDKEKLRLLKLASSIVKEEEANLSSISSLVNYLTQFTNTQTLFYWLYRADELDLAINHGKDIIRNDFNHLPYLVFYNSRNHDLATEMFKINTLVSSGHDISDYREEIIDSFKRAIFLIDFDSGVADDKLHAAIVISWLNMITTPKKERDDSIDSSSDMNEEHIISFLYRFIQVYQSLDMTLTVQERNNRPKLIFERSNISPDIGYLLLWLLRRNLRFTECNELGKELIRLYPNDPRMYHGIALNSISEYYHHRKMKTGIELSDLKNDEVVFIEKSISNLQNALAGYLTDNDNLPTGREFKNLIAKNILSVQNSLIDMSLRHYLVQKDIHILKDAREYLNSMKKLFVENDLIYENYTIPNYTEAELEYLEAKYFFESGDTKSASVKILHATNRAYQVMERYTKMDDVFKSVILDIDQLRIKIFKALKII